MGLIGENGAGKSTLIKIITGIYTPTAGKIILNGAEVSIPDHITAKGLGLTMVPQEFNLVNTLAVYENIFLGNEIRLKSGLLDKRQMKKLAAAQLAALKVPVDVNSLIGALSVAQKQMVEISKALMLHAKILIMDEPTTTLTRREIDTLFALMRDLQAQGVTMIFVSHKLGEIKEICNRVTVLRDGKLISVDNIEDVNEEDIARQMIGRDFTQQFPEKLERPADDIALDVQGLAIPGLLHDVSFNVRKGEIVGFSGLVGAGRTETMEALMCLRRAQHGTVAIDGKKVVIKTPAQAVAAGLGYLSEDRQGKGVVQGFNLPQNITLVNLKAYTHLSAINKKKELAKAAEYKEDFHIQAANMKMLLRYLSGGNQQKVYLSRWVDTQPKVLILDEPTRGIDVNAKHEIYEFIHRIAENGISCVVISSELEEVIGLCSRVYVMREGAVAGCLEGSHINEEEIMFLATGITGNT
jgi:ribose transport system ATP-binding protein